MYSWQECEYACQLQWYQGGRTGQTTTENIINPYTLMTSDFKIYFNWSANALMPVNSGAADGYLSENKNAILRVAKHLLQQIGYEPHTIYRGLLMKDEVSVIPPREGMQYCSFSESYDVALHFADPDGFGAIVLDNRKMLGEHGYLIEYTPQLSEVLFHYSFLSILPYDEAFTQILNLDGATEVEGLKEQKEIIIQQPALPFTQIQKVFFV
jgi:hypothetical protein